MAGIASSGPSPEQAAEQQQLRRGIREAIRALSPKLRDTLLLAQAGDYSYDELKSRIRANLQQVTQMRRYIDSQRKLVYVHVMQDRAYGATSIFDRP